MDATFECRNTNATSTARPRRTLRSRGNTALVHLRTILQRLANTKRKRGNDSVGDMRGKEEEEAEDEEDGNETNEGSDPHLKRERAKSARVNKDISKRRKLKLTKTNATSQEN